MKSRFIRATVVSCTAVLFALTLWQCNTPSNMKVGTEAIDGYEVALRETKHPVSEAARSEGLERWKALMGDFSEANIKGKVEPVYSDDAFFNDTLKTLRGAAQIEEYLLETAELLHSGTVRFDDAVSTGADTYVRWKMVYRSKKLSPGQEIVTIGMTHLRFDGDGMVIIHQDFWDSTRGVFEHVPLVGAGIRAVKRRL